MRRIALSLALLLARCGGHVDVGTCDAKPAEIGNCFTNLKIATPAACGLPASSASRIQGGPCDRLCPTGTNYCGWDGTSTLRCEQCAK